MRSKGKGPAGTLIVGAGVAGLAAGLAARARRLEFQIVEAAERPGGLVQTDELGGFRFDRTAHVLHFRAPHVRKRFQRLGVELRSIKRCAAVAAKGTLVPYPVQYNLWALGDAGLASSLFDDLERAVPKPAAACGSFADLLESRWGSGLVSLFFRPYNEKLWGRPLEQLPAACAGDYLGDVDLELARAGVSGPVEYEGYNGHFLYPASGRLGDIANRLAYCVRPQLHCGESVAAVDLESHEAVTSEGRVIVYERLVGTAPLPALLNAAGHRPNGSDLFDATTVANVRIAFSGKMRTRLHWLYTPDLHVPFHRIAFPPNLTAATCPAGSGSLSVEYTVPLRGTRTSADEVASAAVAYVGDLGLIDADEVTGVWETVISPAYVVHRGPTRDEIAEVQSHLADRDVHLAGRFGEWDYLSIEQAFISGTRAIDAVGDV